MIDSRFFQLKQPLSLKEVALKGDAQIVRGDPDRIMQGVGSLESAKSLDVSFYHNVSYKEALVGSCAGAIFIAEEHASDAPSKAAVLLTSQPLKAFCNVLQAFYKEKKPVGIHASAVIHESAVIGEGCVLEAGVVIGEGARLGKGCQVGAHTVIGPYVKIGAYGRIDSHVSITHADIGNSVVIKPGARIGQPGFGFVLDAQHVTERTRQLQMGRVLIGDDVEIGANTTIDRGSLKDTVIGSYVRLDNLVQIAHNVVLEEGCVVVAQSGIAGSTRLCKGVVMGAQVGVVGHIIIGEHAKIMAKSGVARSVKPLDVMAGIPAVSRNKWHRQRVFLEKLTKRKKS